MSQLRYTQVSPWLRQKLHVQNTTNGGLQRRSANSSTSLTLYSAIVMTVTLEAEQKRQGNN